MSYYYECPACRECIGITDPFSDYFMGAQSSPERICNECFEEGCVACILDDLCVVCAAGMGEE